MHKTYEELESYMDKELELKSRYLCYLRECMEAADEEYTKLQCENGYSDEKTAQNSPSDDL